MGGALSLPSMKSFLAVAVKKHSKVNIKVFQSCPILLVFFTLVQHSVRDYLRKQIFGHNSVQPPSKFIFGVFSKVSKHFFNF